MPPGKALIGQSGGPTSVINQSLVGLIEGCRAADPIRGVLGAVHGIAGILEDRLIDLGRESTETLEGVAVTPCAALRSVRKKPTREECERVLAAFQRHEVRAFFYIGGNDSAETAHILNELALEQAYDVRLFHVPKTIDNDLCVTDHCPGYGSAARFVGSAFMGDNQDNRSLPGIKIDIVMGRHAGWLTAASVLARQHDDDGPHLVYVPERIFDLDAFLGDVDRVYTRHGRCLVAASEGIHLADGKPLIESTETDSHGNVQLSGSGALGDFLAAEIKARLGSNLRVRADTFGYLQRSFAGYASPVDAREAREVGRAAARMATAGELAHGSVIIEREEGEEYRSRVGVTALENVAQHTRTLDEEYLLGDNDIAPAFLDYVAPLAGEMPRTARLSDFPLGG
ncbi:MAG: 6-phosphofructokinase [Planctomycetes bacterium]|jgi:6-phosphofructokinase 1|nr:6-phosphofructokinase [Planctomycetota bacterium]